MNNKIKLSSLSFAAILALQGCGGGDYKATSNNVASSSQSSFIQKDGLSGKVLASNSVQNATVCFDINKNGKCDSGEPSEKTYENGRFSFSAYNTKLSNGAPLVANINAPIVQSSPQNSRSNPNIRNVNSKYTLTAIQKSSNQIISPYTTLINNEILFNPTVQGDEQEAIKYLKATALFNENYLENEDYSHPTTDNLNAADIVSSFQKSYDETKPLESIASVIDEIIKEKKFKIDKTAISAYKRYDNAYLLEQKKEISIDTQDGNQRAVGVKANSSKTIIHSKWNNRLTILNSSDESKQAVNNYLNGRNGDPFPGVSSGADSVSGASEKILSKMILTDDSIYSLVKKDKSKNNNDGLGIYRSSFNGSTVPTLVYGSLSTGVNYYKHSLFTDFSLNHDKTKLIASSSENKIFIFDSKNFSSPIEVNTNGLVRAIAYSSNNNNYFAGYNNSINVYDSNNNIISSFSLKKQIKQILAVSASKILVSFASSKEIKLIDFSNLNDLKVRTYTTDENVNQMNLSPDKKSFALSLENSKTINSFLLEDNSVVAKATVSTNKADDYVSDFVFTTNSKLIAVTDFKAFSFELKGNGKAPTEQEKNDWINKHRVK